MRTKSNARTIARLATATAAVAAFSVAAPMRADAAGTCDGADFTVDGAFDMEGYLACLAASEPGAMPSSGSNSRGLVGVAAGITAVGAGAVAVSMRKRRLVVA